MQSVTGGANLAFGVAKHCTAIPRLQSRGRPINAHGVFDEGHLEAGDRAPEAPEMLQVGCIQSDKP
jgi:hypothetical protein